MLESSSFLSLGVLVFSFLTYHNDSEQLKLRWYGSDSVVKYPRCSLRRQSVYADAEVIVSEASYAVKCSGVAWKAYIVPLSVWTYQYRISSWQNDSHTSLTEITHACGGAHMCTLLLVIHRLWEPAMSAFFILFWCHDSIGIILPFISAFPPPFFSNAMQFYRNNYEISLSTSLSWWKSRFFLWGD